MRSWTAPDVYKPFARNVLLYDGPSMLTGARILVIAGASNGNRKIGHMVQLWIMPAISPIAAVRSGADDAVCGDCKLRGDENGKGRACYVEWWRSVENIWQARGKAVTLTPREFASKHAGLQLRIGAYGDPVAVPLKVWRPLLETAAGWTAYTHQWQTPLAADYRDWCMASVDTAAERAAAAKAGWRTFRIRMDLSDPIHANEVICPASNEAGHRATCADCELCRGTSRQAKSVVIATHGYGAASKNFIRLTAVNA